MAAHRERAGRRRHRARPRSLDSQLVGRRRRQREHSGLQRISLQRARKTAGPAIRSRTAKIVGRAQQYRSRRPHQLAGHQSSFRTLVGDATAESRRIWRSISLSSATTLDSAPSSNSRRPNLAKPKPTSRHRRAIPIPLDPNRARLYHRCAEISAPPGSSLAGATKRCIIFLR